jgi:predicted Zn finger-like uncharacterized protein
MYTICPACHAVFRINAAQLGIAGGRVRCGECRQLFVALDRLYDTVDGAQAILGGQGEGSAQPARPVAAGAPEYSSAETALADLYDEPQTALSAAPAPHQGPAYTAGYRTHPEDFDEPEISLPREPGADEGPAYAATGSIALGAYDESSMPEEEPGGPEDGIRGEDRDLEGEPGDYEDPEHPAAVSTAYDTWDEWGAVEEKLDETAERIARKEGEVDDGRHDDEGPGENLEDLPIEDEHLIAELRAASGQRGLGHMLRSALVALLLLAVLAGQYLWFVRPEWVYSQPVLRPWLERACRMFDCELPARRDVASIELLDREVRKHPRVDDALLVNATLVNNAAYGQPYPVLQLSFSDLSGTRLASRRFRPEEYLAPGSDAGSGMPVREQVHVILELIDPGNNAVSFQFDFL